MEFTKVTINGGKVDIVNGKAVLGIAIEMEDLLAQRDQLREWADQGAKLRVVIEAQQLPLPVFGGAKGDK